MKENESFQESSLEYFTEIWVDKIKVFPNEAIIHCIDPTDDRGLGFFRLNCQHAQLQEICDQSMGLCDLLEEPLRKALQKIAEPFIEIDVRLLYYGALYLNNLEFVVTEPSDSMDSLASRLYPEYILQSSSIIEKVPSKLWQRNQKYGQLLAIDQNLAQRYEKYTSLVDQEIGAVKARIITDLEPDELFELAALHHNHQKSRLRVREAAGLYIPI